jgi:DNA polymerase I-like protein with 3'-5' exonuclease and polymerase domains
MPTVSYGPKVKQRTRRLLEALLAYANDELENTDHLEIDINWQTEKQLLVETKVRILEELTALDPYNGKLASEEIKEALHRLEDHLGILQDNRTKTQGSEEWRFTLKLWYRRYDTQANLKRLDEEWERRRSQKSRQVAGEENENTAAQKYGNRQAIQNLTSEIVSSMDWGEAPDVSSFYGRTEELSQLEQWIVCDRTKVVALFGMGGS